MGAAVILGSIFGSARLSAALVPVPQLLAALRLLAYYLPWREKLTSFERGEDPVKYVMEEVGTIYPSIAQVRLPLLLKYLNAHPLLYVMQVVGARPSLRWPRRAQTSPVPSPNSRAGAPACLPSTHKTRHPHARTHPKHMPSLVPLLFPPTAISLFCPPLPPTWVKTPFPPSNYPLPLPLPLSCPGLARQDVRRLPHPLCSFGPGRPPRRVGARFKPVWRQVRGAHQRSCFSRGVFTSATDWPSPPV
jgi:hypothetical protein